MTDAALFASIRAELTTAVVGDIMDALGYSRDTLAILAQGFPCFLYGCYAQDQRPRGRVVDFRCTIQFGDVTVRPADIVFGDLDGVCVVPSEIEETIFRGAQENARAERKVFAAIQDGMKARESWDRFGVM